MPRASSRGGATRRVIVTSGRLLVVDDDDVVRATVHRVLTEAGHHVDPCDGAAAALAALEKAPYDVVITDLRMPLGSGLDLLAEIRRRWPQTRTILMSGAAVAADAAIAIDHGISHLLLKPFTPDELSLGVAKVLAEARTVEQDRRAVDVAMAAQREAESRAWILRATHALAAAVEVKDTYTAGHASRVTAYAAVIAEACGATDLVRLRLATDLHDVGKIGVPDAVLNKPGPLTPEEFTLIQRHPVAGERILRALVDDALVLGVVRSHHERWDGGGYPDGLAGAAIPLHARIVAVADALDAVTSRRAYRDARPWAAAVAEIRLAAGTQFDPDIIAGFESVLPRLEELWHGAWQVPA